jgi:GxxExxY protein
MERVLGAVFEVANILGAGFLEKVYERALLRELQLRGIPAVTQPSFPVDYKGQCVGHYFADILVDDVLVVELKCADHLTNEHMAQCLNYLRASGITLCLLVNFQKPIVEWKRIVFNFPFTAIGFVSGHAMPLVACRSQNVSTASSGRGSAKHARY